MQLKVILYIVLDGVIMLTYYQDIYMWKVFFPVRQESAVFLANL